MKISDRKNVRTCFAAALLLALAVPVCGCGGEKLSVPEPVPVPLEEGASYVAKPELILTFPAKDQDYHIIQGTYFNGEYYFVAMTKSDDPRFPVYIQKLDREGNLVQESKGLDLDHANNITYNPRTGYLLVSHCQSKERDRYSAYSLVDPRTLRVAETGNLEAPFFAMAYSPERDMYASGRWAGETLDTWDGDLSLRNTFFVAAPESLSQGCFCDRDFIWFVRSSQNGAPCELRIYNWEGKQTFAIPIEGMTVEPESINLVDGTVYIVCNNAAYNGGEVYQLTFEKR